MNRFPKPPSKFTVAAIACLGGFIGFFVILYVIGIQIPSQQIPYIITGAIGGALIGRLILTPIATKLLKLYKNK